MHHLEKLNVLMSGETFGFICHLVTLETIPLEIKYVTEFEHVPWKPGKRNSPV